MSIKLSFAAALLGLTLAQTLHAEPLGRLFLTPERRATLERQRLLNIQAAQALESSTMNLNGVVVRSSGKHTVWINDRAQHDNTAPAGVSAQVTSRDPARAVLNAGEDNPAPLKVGETFNRATGNKTDVIGDGRVSVKRPPSPKSP